jgi:hypothetical protein
VGIVSGISVGVTYAPLAGLTASSGPPRAGPIAPPPPSPSDLAAPLRAGDTVTCRPLDAGFASVAATLDGLAHISNALATADAALASEPPAKHVTFGGKPLLDGSYTVSVNGVSLCLAAATDRNAAESRRSIDQYRREVIGPAVNVALESMEALAPGAHEPGTARTLALLVRAQTLVRPETAMTAADGLEANRGGSCGPGHRALGLLTY